MQTEFPLSKLFRSIDQMDADGFMSFLTDDAVFRYGSQQPVEGGEAIHGYVAEFFGMFDGLRHRLIDAWEGDDSVVCQGEVTYLKKDGSETTLPFVNVFRLEGDKIHDYLVHIDPSPLMG